MLAQIEAFLRRWLPAFEADQRSYLTVAIGCTGGQHRSVYFVEQLARALRRAQRRTLMRHRELDADAMSRSLPAGRRRCRCSRCRRVLFPGRRCSS